MSAIRAVLLVAVLGLATACGGGEQSPGAAQTTTDPATTTTEAASTTTAAPTASVEVPKQLQFTAKTVDGAAFDGASLAGKPAVLWFWAPWCPKCNAEAPGLHEVWQANSGKVTFVGVAGQDQVPAMQQFVQKYSLDFVHLADLDGSLWTRFGVSHQPAYAFFNSSGELQMELHQLSKDALATRVAGLA
jgi:thiol-disulfide isomerase/thioredoxin